MLQLSIIILSKRHGLQGLVLLAGLGRYARHCNAAEEHHQGHPLARADLPLRERELGEHRAEQQLDLIRYLGRATVATRGTALRVGVRK